MEAASRLDYLRDVDFEAPDLLKAWVYVATKFYQMASPAAAEGRMVRFFREQKLLPLSRRNDSFEELKGHRFLPLFGVILYEGRDSSGRYIIMSAKPGAKALYKVYEMDIMSCGPYWSWRGRGRRSLNGSG